MQVERLSVGHSKIERPALAIRGGSGERSAPRHWVTVLRLESVAVHPSREQRFTRISVDAGRVALQQEARAHRIVEQKVRSSCHFEWFAVSDGCPNPACQPYVARSTPQYDS